MPNHQTRVYSDVMEMLSSEDNPTPMVRLNRVVGYAQTQVYAKLEWYNPFGAVKDRVAANMIRVAKERGLMSRNQKLVEPTSGNTGMGLAMVSNQEGYSLTTPLSKQIPAEKRIMLRFFGADVEELDDTLCPAPWATEGAIARAQELAARPDFHMLNQYENEANFEAHIRTTGPEIWRQTEGRITHFVAGLGTCGTITGNGRFLKGKNPDIQIIGVHPAPGHEIPGVRSLGQLKQTKLFFPDEYDALIEVSNDASFQMCLRLNQEESLIAGPSSGMALVGLLEIIEDQPDAVVVVMFPDNAFKYASSLERHFPQFRAARAPGEGADEPSPKEQLLTQLVSNSRNAHNTCELEDLRGWLDADPSPLLIDVRGTDIYAAKHIVGAVNIPVAELQGHSGLPEDRDAPIVTVCNRGNMSISGMLVLQSLGYSQVRSLNGGTVAWDEAGLPTE